jgi:endonuclease YncB( thermonuclease family)
VKPFARLRRTALAAVLASLPHAGPVQAGEAMPVTCKRLSAIDGDTVKCDGIAMRDMGDGAPFVSGYDAPEIRKARCTAEKALGQAALRRMRQLLKSPGLRIVSSGKTDNNYGRPLVWLTIGGGRSIGSILIAEGLARVWTPGYRAAWCAASGS